MTTNTKEYSKEYYLKNKDRINAAHRKWRRKNWEFIKEWDREYYLKNKEQIDKSHRKWALNNKEKMNKSRNRYVRKRIKTDLNYKLRMTLKVRLQQALKGLNKSKRTMELLGCTIDELWTHLESKFTDGMTRDNHGTWHVDHIKACTKFDLTDPEQQQICFHWSNLQPLWARDNIRKGNK